MSPLVYICVTDVLHEGLLRNPIYNETTGYRFLNDPDLIIASTGYADDTMTYCETWRDQWLMHEWIRDFCHIHGFELNVSKCKYIVSDYQGPSDPRFLWSVDGKHKMLPRGSSETFRYLVMVEYGS